MIKELSIDETREILEYYLVNKNIKKTAKHFKHADRLIRRILITNNISFEEVHKKSFSDEEVIKFYLQPASLRETAKYFKTNTHMIMKVLRANNISAHNQEIRVQLAQKHKEETFLTKYGVSNPSYLPEVVEKRTNTCLKHFGTTCALKNEIVKEKIKQTCKEKYGVENPSQSQEIKDKKYATQKANNSFNFSKPEIILYKSLCEKFGQENVLKQYKEERYPFNCDFYVKSKDLFIELNMFFSHGTHAFNENNPEDIKLLNIWKEKSKNSPMYKDAIDVWTTRDPLKIKTAIENKLNYIALYTWEDINNFLKEAN